MSLLHDVEKVLTTWQTIPDQHTGVPLTFTITPHFKDFMARHNTPSSQLRQTILDTLVEHAIDLFVADIITTLPSVDLRQEPFHLPGLKPLTVAQQTITMVRFAFLAGADPDLHDTASKLWYAGRLIQKQHDHSFSLARAFACMVAVCDLHKQRCGGQANDQLTRRLVRELEQIVS